MAHEENRPKNQSEAKVIVLGSESASPRVQLWRWSVAPATAKVLKGVSAVGLLGIAGWLLQNFLQLRGVVNLLASRIDLAFLAICLLAVVWILTIGVRNATIIRIFLVLLVIVATFAIDHAVRSRAVR